MMMLVLMVVGAQAQATFGLKGGLNYATIGGDDTDEVDGRFGYHFGGMASFGLTESVFLQPEVVLSLQGASQNFMSETYFSNLTYINVSSEI